MRNWIPWSRPNFNPASNETYSLVVVVAADTHDNDGLSDLAWAQTPEAGDIPASRQWLTSKQVNDSLGKALLTDHDVQFARTGDLFENFQFSEAHEGRVAFEQLGG